MIPVILASTSDIGMYIGAMILGFVGLYFGAEWLVEGASRIAKRIGVSPLIVGITVVSFGTSLPEFVVSLFSVLQDPPAPGITVGNIFGSNIANTFLILGITYCIKAPNLPFSKLRMDYFVMLMASILVVVLGFWDSISQMAIKDGLLNRRGGIILCSIMVCYMLYLARWGAKSEEVEEAHKGPQKSAWILLGMTVAGLVVLTLGARSLVWGAVGCATIMGVSDVVIGATVIAIGTSLPELFASAVAAAKGHPEIAIGNVLGSNVFNILFVLGVVGGITDVEFSKQVLVEQVPFMLLSAFCFGGALMMKSGVGRKTGVLFLALYAVFTLVACQVIKIPY